MARINKTENNLQKAWNNFDKAYELLEAAIEDLSKMKDIPSDLQEMIDTFDLTMISCMKEQIELLLEQKK